MPETYDRYLAWALNEGTTPNGVFGAKLMWGYLGDFAQLLRGIDGLAGLPVPELLERVFPDLRYVRITRRDKVRQAVSLWRAVQTQAWRQEGGRRATRGASRPSRSARSTTSCACSPPTTPPGTPTSSASATQPLTITYEELAEAHEPVVRRVLDAHRRARPARPARSSRRG